MEHENEHLDIREKLLRLPKLQADENFLKRLQIQIDVLDSEERTRDVVVRGSASGFFKNLFGARLVPALGISSVVVAAFLVYFILADKKDAVVNNIASNKTTETIITHEQPTDKSPAPTITEDKEIPKKEDTDLKKNEVADNTESYGVTTKKQEDESSNIRKNVSQDMEPVKTTEIKPEVRGRTNDVTKETTTVTTQQAPAVKSDEKIKSTSPELKQGIVKTEKSGIVEDQEKSINEGGRGNTDAKKPQSSIKPKKKDINSNIDINKSVLESLRDKLK